MPLSRSQTPEGTVWLRPPFRPEDYAAPAEAVRLFERWKDDPQPADAILFGRESPFSNYVEVDRETRDGRTRITLLEASAEFAIEIEAGARGFASVLPLPPERAYELACSRDALRSVRVVRQ